MRKPWLGNRKTLQTLGKVMVLGAAWLLGCVSPAADRATGLQKANQWVGHFGKKMGVADAVLDEQGDRSFGEVGFRYDLQHDLLTGRVYIGKVRLADATETGKINIRKNIAALNDPAIGGRFDQGGGHFVFDQSSGFIFLVKEFSLMNTAEAVFQKDMEALMNLGATWTMHWFHHVVKMAHGYEAPPAEKVMQGNEAYQ